MARTLIILGKVWLCLAGGLIALGYLSILYFEGWGKFRETISPFNIVNWLTVLITLLPGILLAELGKRLRDRAPTKDQGL